jgi:two-component system sensor histidine kinase CiaH
MFVSVGRRLALLNAVVVVAVIALVGIATFILLRQSLDREADGALAERAAMVRVSWSDLFASGQSVPATLPRADGDDDDREDDEPAGDTEADDESEEDEAYELVESGDILLFAVDANGRLLANARGLTVPGLPDPAGVAAALAGNTDARSIQIASETMRVYTTPARNGDRIVGAIQAARSEREHQSELRLVGVMSLAGVGLGAILAVPIGLFLAQRAMQPIDAAFARQRAFIADASHELRTPLTLIRATTELVQRLPEASPAVREELDDVLDEIDATDRLVGDLLLLARLDSDEYPLRLETLDLGEVVRTAAASFTPLAAAAGLALTIETPSGILVAGDGDRIRQVVRILLDNAISYTPVGGSIRVVAERRGPRAVVAVSDTGTGIPPAEQAHVFDRFYRADRARSRGTGGTGLGLAIARALVLAHHGEIGLESQQGVGTTVRFTLPVATAS